VESTSTILSSLLDAVRHALGGFFFTFTYPGSRVFVGWLAVFALAVLVLTRRGGDRSFLGPHRQSDDTTLLARAFPRRIWRSPSAKVDYMFFATERLVEFFLVASAAVSSGRITGWIVESLNATTGDVQGLFTAGPFVVAGYTLVSLFMYDVGYSIGHLLGHKVPVLWEFHKLHHVPDVLNPATNFRVHPVDSVVIGSCIALAVGVTDAVFIVLFGPDIRVFEIAGTNALFLPVFALVSFRHSHVWIPFSPNVSRWLSSPAMHQIHHSVDERHWDKNLCQIFSCIDRAMGTLYVPTEKEELVFGVPGYEGRMNNSLLAAYLEPFVGVYAVLRGKRTPVSDPSEQPPNARPMS